MHRPVSLSNYRASSAVTSSSGIESLCRPTGSGPSEHEPVMETVQPPLPKLYSPRNESVSSPERRKRDFLFLETIFDLGKPILKDQGFREHVTLARRPGSYLTSPTPRVEICLRLRQANPLRFTLEPHLPLKSYPVHEERNAWVLVYLPGLAASVIRVKNEAVGAELLE